MVNFVSLAATAERLIEANGRSMQLTKRGGTTPLDPAEPWRGDTTTGDTVFSVIAVEVEFENEDFDGTLVRRGDKKMLVAANSVDDASSGAVDIEEFDEVLDGAKIWRIEQVNAIIPGPTRIMYELQVRK